MDNTKEQIISFIRNPVLLSCIFSWLSAQFIKTLINLFSGKIHSVQELFELLIWRTGGMPSSHSALVATLCTTIAFRSGINSDVFLLSLGFFMVTIRDAVGVRRANGIQAKIINKIGRSLAEKKLIDDFKPVKEVNGHTPAEVAIGCLIGFFIGLAFSLFK
ncbi:MAG: divergent PAP2 family protein [Treponema sp.]|nr:divergent PAP2 family protein [Treponema sp.]MBQ4236165.1 divergent PAP2 family protein [Treponema sp.]MBQ5384307.1 divergent PAP2 family protein [Treponema sp.]